MLFEFLSVFVLCSIFYPSFCMCFIFLRQIITMSGSCIVESANYFYVIFLLLLGNAK
ncbi:hypothetical protein FH5_04376 [Priestia endophytica]|nr:hypothetical protein FH5_04376 [Priestia endophytica]